MASKNLERSCAAEGFSLSEKAKNAFIEDGGLSKKNKTKMENTISKAVGILNSDGPFAFVVWLEYKNSLNPETNDAEQVVAKLIHETSYEILLREGFINSSSTQNGYKHLKHLFVGGEGIPGLCDNIHQMFLIKGVLEKMLSYALYNAKAFGATETSSSATPITEE